MTNRFDISDPAIREALAPRHSPYFKLLQYCRHIGIHVSPSGRVSWVARVRRKDGGYTQRQLGCSTGIDFEEAKNLAEAWFANSSISKIAAEPYQIGSKQSLSVCPIGPVLTVGSALASYLDWKKIAGRKSYFETLVSLTNYYIVPRLASVPLEDFNGKHFSEFCLEVLEMPPKRGRFDPITRNKLSDLSEEDLRKRKKTLNAIISILKGTFLLAWERGDLQTDFPIRCLKRLPNVDRPRVIFLDRAECRALLKACDDDFSKLVKAALYTGCRSNELRKMIVGDFKPRSAAVYVSSAKGVRQRYVFLPPEGREFFLMLATGRTSSENLFIKRNGSAWGTEYKSRFQIARRTAGLPETLTFHGLRHTYASQLIQGGASLLTVAEQLGHANVQTVSTTYGHLCAHQRQTEVAASFEPLRHKTNLDGATFKTRRLQNIVDLHQNDRTSWPRSNHSRFSGPLLSQISPNTR
jgi:integrase